MKTSSAEVVETRRFVGTATAAKYLDKSRDTMRWLRITGRGPRFRIVNGRALYDIEDLDAFVAAHPLISKTSEAAA